MYYGDYYRGDYYRGDPGLFGFLGKAVKTGLGIAGTVLPGPLGTAARAARGIFGTRKVTPPPPTIVPPTIAQPIAKKVPVGMDPVTGMPAFDAPELKAGRKRRRMNYGNTKALRRADRRIDGFVKVARNALKHTNYKVVSKSAGRSRGGSPGVITRSEARRALRG